MNKFKKITSVILASAMVSSVAGTFNVLADNETNYTFYTHVGDTFTPQTDEVTWDQATVDTSVMGRRIITGTKDGATVKGIVNVGTKKYSVYTNMEDGTVGSPVNTTAKGTWKKANDDTTTVWGNKTLNGDESNKAIKYTLHNSSFKDSRIPAITMNVPTSDIANFETSFRIKPENMTTDSQQVVLSYRDDAQHNVQPVIKKVASGYVAKVGGTPAAVVQDAEGWIWLKITYVSGKFYLYDLNSASTDYIDSSVQEYGNLSSISLQAANNVSAGINYNEVVYLDDFTLTDTSTTDYIYYDDFTTDYNATYVSGDTTETMVFDEDVKLVSETGADSGYSVPFYAKADVDTSVIGKGKKEVSFKGFDKPVTFNWEVLKEQVAWSENFEGYQDTDLGKAPTLLPWLSSNNTTGVTVEKDTSADNQYLKFTSAEEKNWKCFKDGKSYSGKVKISMRVNNPELKSGESFAFQIFGDVGGTEKLILDPTVMTNSSGGRIYFQKTYDSNNKAVTPVANGKLQADKWYTLTMTIDTDTDTFTYVLDDGEEQGPYDLNQSGMKLNANSVTGIKFAQRGEVNVNTTDTATLYIDDISLTQYLGVKEAVANQSMTVYMGESTALPSTVKVLLTDGVTTADAPVDWNGATIDTSVPGTQTFTGTVSGVTEPITYTVNVKAVPYEVKSINLTDSEGKEIYGLQDGAKVASVTVSKLSNATVNCNVFVAAYNADGTMVAANAAVIPSDDWATGANKDINVALDLSGIENVSNCELKVWILGSSSLTPLAAEYKLSDTVAAANLTAYIAGDSTAAAKAESERPETGWGEAFASLCSGTGIAVENYALGGASSKSFYDSGLLANILSKAKSGDYLFIQFGHNDAKTDEARYTEPNTTYKEYLAKYITEAKAKGVNPVILTSVVRGYFSNGTTGDFIGDTRANLDKYAQAAREVAAEYHVPCVDIHKLTADKFKSINAEDVLKYYDYTDHQDQTHLNKDGAELVSGMVKSELTNMLVPIAKLFD